MANQEDSSNKTNHHGDYRTVPDGSRPELNPNETPSEGVASLDNLTSDCLELIFKFLDPGSLLNVASTCTKLQSEAASFFNTKTLTLCHNLNHSPYIIIGGKQQITGLNSCLKFLRYFGADILNLTVQWQTWYYYKTIDPMLIPKCKCHTALDQYINRYCAESLSTLSFHDKSEFSNENYLKPFVNVDTVRLFHCGLAQQLPRFIEWFPNLRHLYIDQGCEYQLMDDMQLHFPHLQHLTTGIFRMDQKKNAQHLLRMNPQLKRLDQSQSGLIIMKRK